MKNVTKPRLLLTGTYETGWSGVLGDFADGPRGRKDAGTALDEIYEHNRNLFDWNGSRPDVLLEGDVTIERIFADGSRQALTRIPGAMDDYPQTLDEAKLQEAKRVMAFLGEVKNGIGQPIWPWTDPLTTLELRADRIRLQVLQGTHQTDEKSSILNKVEDVLAKDRAGQTAERLEARLPAVSTWAPPKHSSGSDGPRMVIGGEVWNPREEVQAQPTAVHQAPLQRLRL